MQPVILALGAATTAAAGRILDIPVNANAIYNALLIYLYFFSYHITAISNLNVSVYCIAGTAAGAGIKRCVIRSGCNPLRGATSTICCAVFCRWATAMHRMRCYGSHGGASGGRLCVTLNSL